ncbi:MAG: M6 family metalloprotease domain-containing protein [Candidatus Marinimicrobia bacterium]|nr:M6 family metalloprotease domain-containing protein [Candidatus Neomarinimicrobiota bacterium]MCF7829131.1 M6 family metalloprotease domain-containing protein [Candidatus Neomarinimicrobiota bacterium]MCF7881470.1 M6 family metalloprotease domain-containing protein [Candidatus Neomarinimicrobiota bacterium]
MRKKYMFTVLIACLLTTGQLIGIEPTPEVKEQWRKQGLLKQYQNQRNAHYNRGIDTPSKYAPDLSNLRKSGFGKAAQADYLNALVILVDFADHQADSASTPAEFDTLLFSENEYSTGSMNDWYLENSYGEIGITGTITPWLRMPENYSYYVDDQYGFGSYPNNAQKLTEDAIAAADSLVDFTQYDNNRDGIVDALFIVHAGDGRETSGSDQDIHSHKWSIEPVTYDEVEIRDYSMEPELHDTSLVRMGVFGHEFGHILGLPDLYDTDDSDGNSAGIGFWSMMAGGSWGGGGKRPVHFDAWCKKELGWITPTVLSADSNGLELPPAESTPKAYRLWTEGKMENEYFLLENRQQRGFDESLPEEGLLIWHIDESISNNGYAWHKKVALEQADGQYDLENNNASDAGDPYPGTSSNMEFSYNTIPNSKSYSGEDTFVRVANIAEINSDITFDAEVTISRPLLTFEGFRIYDRGSNGNGALNSGEIDTIGVAIKNEGTKLENASIFISSNHPDLTILRDSINVGTLQADTEVRDDTSFIVQVNPDAAEWGISRVYFHATGRNSFTFSDSMDFIIDQGYGFDADMETGHLIWSHFPVTKEFNDEWHLSSVRNATTSGKYSWKVGDPARNLYSDNSDAALQTPVLYLEDSIDYELVFKQYLDAEDDSSAPGYAWDGGRVEITADSGRTWEAVTPIGGYPYQIIDNPDSPFDAETPVFSGFTGWEQVRVPLDDYFGEIIIRFRFGSDAYVTKEGWYVDDVKVQSQTILAVGSDRNALPGATELLPNYPNPFNPVTTIPYRISNPAPVHLAVYDLRGRTIRTLVNSREESGSYTVQWNGRDAYGHPVGSGIYFLRLSVGREMPQIRKLTLIR